MLWKWLSGIHRSLSSTRANSEVSMSAITLFEPNVATKKATFAMGCFWHPDSLFGSVKGVVRTRVGYTGGTKANPTYYDIGDHTEAVDIDYNPNETDFKTLLGVFWHEHDPTIKHKRQYISSLYYHDDDQEQLARDTLAETQKSFARPILTEVVKATTFYDAEDYHQKYRMQQYGVARQLGLANQEQLIKSHVAMRLNAYLGGYGTAQEFDKDWEHLGLPKTLADFVRKEVAKGITPHC